jgi:glycosyltransferase involved in cell wall biosynthesis
MKWGFLSLGNGAYDAESPYKSLLGGTQSAIVFTMEHLKSLGENIVFWNEDLIDSNLKGIKHINININNLKKINDEDIDVLIFVGRSDLISSVKKHLKKNIPLIFWTQHSYDQEAIQELKDQENIKKLSAIIFVSDWQELSVIGHLKLNNIKTIVIENGISPPFINLFKDLKEFKDKKRELIGCYASTPFRGLEELLKSSIFINYPIKIKIFSSMKIYNMPDHNFEELYNQLKKSDKFIYYGSINKPELALEFRSSSFLTYPSTFEETFCVTLIDSLAAGMRPILTDLGALKETSNGFASFLINKKISFHEDYANLINKEINIKQNNYDLWCENRFNQIQIINEKYNYKNIAQKWINIIKNL